MGDDGEKYQAWLDYPTPSPDIRRWSYNSRGDRFPLNSQLTFFDVINEVEYTQCLEDGWREHVDPVTKTLDPGLGAMNVGFSVRLKCLREYWLAANPSPDNSQSIATPSRPRNNGLHDLRPKTPVRSRIPYGIMSPPRSRDNRPYNLRSKPPVRSMLKTPTPKGDYTLLAKYSG